MTLVQGYLEIENAELFDTFHFETIPVDLTLPTYISLFSQPARTVKPEADTNLIMSNQLPWPERFEVESIACWCDSDQILDCYDFDFLVSHRRILAGGLSSVFSYTPLKRTPLKFSLFGTHFKAKAAA